VCYKRKGAMAQTISSAMARVRFQVSPRESCGEQKGIVTGSCPIT